MTYTNLLTELRSNILIITINRPDKLNALNRQTLNEIRDAVQSVYDNSEIKGAIITGSGNKAFVAGADISEFKNASRKSGEALAQYGHDIFFMIERCPKPIIAAVNGFCLGGGCEMAMSCHIRVASENAKFGQPEVNLGIVPGYGGTQRMVQLVGKAKALELIMTADIIGAQDAWRIGLVNHVTGNEALIPKCMEILEKIKQKAPVAIARTINCVNGYFEEGTDGFKKEVEEFGYCCETEDFAEGTAAFLEKRKANFKGK